MKDLYKSVIIKMPIAQWERASALVAWVADHPSRRLITGGRRSVSMVIRLALDRGLAALEHEHAQEVAADE